MFNVNECISPDDYIFKTKKNVFTNIFNNLSTYFRFE